MNVNNNVDNSNRTSSVMDRTTKKLIGIEYKKGVTMAGVLKASPKKLFDLYTKAITVVESNLDMGDLDAAKFVINHADGTPKSKVDITTNGKDVSAPVVDLSTLTPSDKDNLRDIIRKSYKGQS